MKLLSPFAICSPHVSFKTVIMLWIGLSPSFCWFASGLSALDQVFTQTLRYRMRFEHLCLTGTVTGLYHHKPVGCSPVIPFSTDCTPPTAVLLSSWDKPNVVLQGETVAMWAQIRQCNSSPSADWRNDSPQEVRAFSQHFSYNTQTSSFFFYHLLVNFLYCSTSPCRCLPFFLCNILGCDLSQWRRGACRSDYNTTGARLSVA